MSLLDAALPPSLASRERKPRRCRGFRHAMQRYTE